LNAYRRNQCKCQQSVLQISFFCGVEKHTSAELIVGTYTVIHGRKKFFWTIFLHGKMFGMTPNHKTYSFHIKTSFEKKKGGEKTSRE
jgi:hypothetical protein